MSNISSKEIVSLIKERVENLKIDIDIDEVGKVVFYMDGVASVYGLNNIMAGEMVEFEDGSTGFALNLEDGIVGIALLDKGVNIKEGSTVKRLKKLLSIPTGKAMLGRVVNILGEPIDGKGAIKTTSTGLIETQAPGIMARKSVFEPLSTGIKSIDALVPIGRGQRELIIGDRQTGKTTVAIDTILNQKDQDVKCIYVAIGQKQSTVARTVKILEEKGALSYTTIVIASASDPAAMQFIAPYTGTTIGEFFRDNGEHALIVYDDLSKHAVAYREMSLILRRPPGREAYPGDVFYIHSRLLERSAKLNDELGGGSLTALPIIETQAGDISAYVPTNVISITDGQIFLETDLFNSGIRPAINVGNSVSRVGGAAQHKFTKQVAGTLRLDLAQYRELQAFSQFASDLEANSRKQLDLGTRMTEMLKQPKNEPVKSEKQAIIIFAVNRGFVDNIDIKDISRYEKEFFSYIDLKHKKICEDLIKGKKFTKEIEDNLLKVLKEFSTIFSSGK